MKGWSAKGLLLPLWQKYPGKRDALAEAVGTKGTVLSSINTGRRNLGYDLGPRLAEELGVSVLELGAPVGAADEAGKSIVLHLEELAAKLATSDELLTTMKTSQRRLEGRVRRLEEALDARGVDVPRGQTGAGR